MQHVLGDGTNDQRLFAAIGLLRCVANPPAELANSIMAVFSTSMGEGLTDKQFAAAQELGRILGDEAAEAFGVLISSPKRRAKRQGAMLLCSIGGRCANEILVAALRDTKKRKITTEILVSIGDEAVEPLTMGLRDSDSLVRRSAANALGKIGDPSAVEPLSTVLRDSDVGVRVSAAKALGKIGDPRAIEPLITARYDLDVDVREIAAEALWKIGDPRALPALKSVAKEDKGETWLGESVAKVAQNAAEKIRQRMAESQKGTKVRNARGHHRYTKVLIRRNTTKRRKP